MSQVSDIARKAQDQAADLAEKAKDAVAEQARAQVDEVKHRAADKVEQVASAADAASDQFDPNSPQAQAINQVASQIENVAAKLRSADVGDIAHQATELARRHPFMFVGGAVLAGFAAARFLKARDPEAHRAEFDDPWVDTAYGNRGV